MATVEFNSETRFIEDLTAGEKGDITLWIGKSKIYRDVPGFVSDELCSRTSALPFVIAQTAPLSLPVMQLIDFSIPRVTKSLQDIDPAGLFSFHDPTHTSLECINLEIPDRILLNKLRDYAGQAMLDGKLTVQHWDKADVFLPFDAIGLWFHFLDLDAAKQSWTRAIQWLKKHRRTIPEHHFTRIMKHLQNVPWKGEVNGLKTGLTVTDMAAFLPQDWLSDTHIASMLTATTHLRHDILSCAVSRTEIVPPDFPSHFLNFELLDASPTLSEYLNSSPPQSIVNLGTLISETRTTGIRIAAISYSPEYHWASLLVDVHAGTIAWGDSLGRPIPDGFEKRLRIWLATFLPGKQFLPLRTLSCGRQTDGYSCGVAAVNALKHNIFGDKLWSTSQREVLRVQEFIDILDFSEGWRTCESTTVMIEDTTPPTTFLPLASPTCPPASKSIEMASEGVLPPEPISESPLSPPKQSAFNVDDMPIAAVHSPTVVEDNVSPSPPVKRPRKHAYPRPDTDAQQRSRANATSGTTKQAQYKRKVLEEVRNGTFKRDHKRWKTFKGKIILMDPNAEVPDDPAHLLSVKHSRCGSWVRMSTPYNTERFKRHVTTYSFSTAVGGMKTLESYGIQVLALNTQSHSSSLSLSTQTRTTLSTQTCTTSSTQTCTTFPCPGLTESDDPRIKQYIKCTSVTSAGGKNVSMVTKQLFKGKYKKLSSKRKDIVQQKQIQTHRWSVDHIRKRIHGIGAKLCAKVSQMVEDGSLLPCKRCLRLLSLRGFRNAIYQKPPKNVNRVYVPHVFQPAEIGKMYGHGFNDLIDGTCNHSDTLRHFVRQVVAGKLDDKPVFLDLVQVITVQTERCERGVGLQNMKYLPAFDDWCHKLLCICPEAYQSFRTHLAGRTERSFLSKRSKSLGFCQGISHQALERARKYLENYKYPIDAPLSLSVDDTKLLPALCPYFNGLSKKWFLVGTNGEPLEISDLNLLEEQIESARSQLATKLRLWVLQIPLPHIPCLILAVMPLVSSTDVATLAQMEQQLLHTMLASDEPLCIVSLGSDGSILERDTRCALVRNGFAETVSHPIPNPSSAQADPIMISLLRIHGRCIAVIQDPKHSRKTARNNLFSGMQLLVLGNHMVCYKQIRDMVGSDDSPLYWRDVDRLDRQDDCAAARLFSAAFLEFCASRHGETNPGLPIYLFVLSELIDAYENRHISHLERIKMVLQMRFFKSLWKSFLHRGM